MVAQRGLLLGSVTNNKAEYSGVTLALSHALQYPSRCMRFHVDSLLVARQLCYQWRCSSVDLRPAYEQALAMLQELRRLPGVSDVEVAHVYREFNSDADGVCIDQNRDVSINWLPFS